MRKYKLIQTKRKTISIKIKENATLEVKAPLKMNEKEIDKFVKSKEKWISENTKRVAIDYKLKQEFSLNFGDSITILGKQAHIYPTEGNIAKYKDGNFFIPKNITSENIKATIIQLAKKIAKTYITERILYFKDKMGVEPTAIRITSAKTRWGSCSGKNSVNFSWRLIMGDELAIDYVVVHELAHIKQHNHSQEFWMEVESILPDYIKRKKNLKTLQLKLNKEDWD